MNVNPLPELPKEDPYYTHARKTCGELVQQQNDMEWEQEQRTKKFVPIASPSREMPRIAVVLSWVGFFGVGILMLAQTEDWTTILFGGAVGAIAGNIIGRILHFINEHKVLIIVTGLFGYLYFSNNLADLGISAPF